MSEPQLNEKSIVQVDAATKQPTLPAGTSKESLQPIFDRSLLLMNRIIPFKDVKAQLDLIASAENPDIVVFPELTYKIDDILGNLETFRKIAKERKMAILLAPENESVPAKNLDTSRWQRRKSELLTQPNLTVDDTNYNGTPQAIGIFFYPDGKIYVFPKSYSPRVHHIPETDYGVSLCGELVLEKVTREEMEGVKIWLHPTTSALDDAQNMLRMRLVKLASEKPLTHEDVNRVFAKEYKTSEMNDEDHLKILERDFGKESANMFFDPISKRREWYQELLARFLNFQSDGNITLADYRGFRDKAINKYLSETHIPCIACNYKQEASGLYNPSSGVNVSSLVATENYVSIHITE